MGVPATSVQARHLELAGLYRCGGHTLLNTSEGSTDRLWTSVVRTGSGHYRWMSDSESAESEPYSDLVVMADLAPFGATRHDFARAVRAGTSRRVRRGAYVPEEIWTALSAREQHLRKLHAVARTRARAPVFSHSSAAAIHGLPLVRDDSSLVHVLAVRRLLGPNAQRGGRARAPLARPYRSQGWPAHHECGQNCGGPCRIAERTRGNRGSRRCTARQSIRIDAAPQRPGRNSLRFGRSSSHSAVTRGRRVLSNSRTGGLRAHSNRSAGL